MIGENGGIIGPTNTPSPTETVGVWTLDEQYRATLNGNWIAPGYNISRSLRFNSADSTYLNRTPASAGNLKTWTWSCWLKRSALGEEFIFGRSSANNDSNFLNIQFTSTNTLNFSNWSGGINISTTQVFRDVGAWYHIVAALDTTQATSSDRFKFYVNGSQITALSATTYPTQNSDLPINAAQAHRIGSRTGASTYLNGYLADINFIDGQALTPSSFGITDPVTGVWRPIQFSGPWGTNGFWLPFSDNSSTAALGYDSSGNGNNWTPNNFSVTAGAGNDSLVDTPTPYGTDTGAGGQVRGNYATFNPLKSNSTTATFSNGNLVASYPSGSAGGVAMATMAVSSGKWYWEVLIGGTDGSTQPKLGVLSPSVLTETSASTDVATLGYAYSRNGTKWIVGSNTAYGSAFTTNDVIGFALDMDAGTLTCYLNNVSQGTLASGLTGSLAPAMTGYNPGTAITLTANFGQRPFAYTAPSGFKALCTQNLPEPTVVQGDDYFNTVLYTGNSGTQAITSVGFQPDLVWIKRRDSNNPNVLMDAVRGFSSGDARVLQSNDTAAEVTNAAFDSFDSSGFTVSGTSGSFNLNAATYVAWNWKANGSGVSNTAGSITSTVSANTTSGFSIVTYTGNNGASGTIGHGLGVAPSMIITKVRNSANGWPTLFNTGSTIYYGLRLNSTAANDSPSGGVFYNNTPPTSTVYTVGSSDETNDNFNYVAYCFAPVAGFSAFGSYTGNGSTDGTFVYTGFRPRWIMFKRTDTAGENWQIRDTARDTYNVMDKNLRANLSDAETTFTTLDALSNGFKFRSGDAGINASGGTYIYAAFAENPFKYSLAR